MQSFGALSFRGYNQVTGDVFDDQAFGYKHIIPDESFQYWADGVLAHHSISGTDGTYEFGVKARNVHSKLTASYNTDVESGTYQPTGFARNTNTFIGIHQGYYLLILGYIDKSPNYGPLDGFTSQSDDRGFQYVAMFNGSTKWMKNWQISLNADRYLDQSGAVHEADVGTYFNATFKNGFSLNGGGPTTSELRCYNGNCYTGFPAYANGAVVPFNLMALPIGYRDGTPTPIDVSANWGSFNGNWLHYYTASTSRPLGSKFTLGLEYDGSLERGLTTGILDSQWLRRISLGYNIDPQTNLTISLRGINGDGGFVTTPGLNLAAAFHTRFKRGDLYINYGSPSANFTLNRLIVKYVFRAGADQGT